MVKSKIDLRLLMKKLGLGTNAFADACGVSTQAMAQYLRNENVTTKTIYKISEALDIDPRDMFFPINEDGNTFIPESSDNKYNYNEVVDEHVIEENSTSTITCPYCSKRFILLDK